MRTILLTNDDGVHSAGLAALRTALSAIGCCVTVAPDRDKSAVSHSLTINRPLKVTELEPNIYAVDGTPADCVALAMKKILPVPPDLLLSGINLGPNLGDDIFYSGTVAAAREATIYGVPAIAISTTAEEPPDYAQTAQVTLKVARRILQVGLPPKTLLNINVPRKCRSQEIQVCRQGRRLWKDSIHDSYDPWGTHRFWIGGGTSVEESDQDTDVYCFSRGRISVTPIQLDQTNHAFLETLGEHLIHDE